MEQWLHQLHRADPSTADCAAAMLARFDGKLASLEQRRTRLLRMIEEARDLLPIFPPGSPERVVGEQHVSMLLAIWDTFDHHHSTMSRVIPELKRTARVLVDMDRSRPAVGLDGPEALRTRWGHVAGPVPHITPTGAFESIPRGPCLLEVPHPSRAIVHWREGSAAFSTLDITRFLGDSLIVLA